MATLKDFYLNDFMKTLFPMDTCRVLMTHGAPEIESYVERCFSDKDADQHVNFLQQTRVFAAKPSRHLRRTVKLDPVAEYFLYKLVFERRKEFRPPFQKDRKHFGYRFVEGEPVSSTDAYRAFKAAVSDYGSKFKFGLSFDVASYFNSVYHHDIVAWMSQQWSDPVSWSRLGTFLRQANSGRSVDCLPQGLYPTKMIGNDYLRFVEQHHAIKSPAVVRFMDDFYFFANNESDIWDDFYLVQKLLGAKGLSVNPSKSRLTAGEEALPSVEEGVDEVKTSLLKKRREIMRVYDLSEEEAAEAVLDLEPHEVSYVMEMLKSQHLEEEDAELILSIFRDKPEEVAPYLEGMVRRFPHLAKNIFSFCKLLSKKTLYHPPALFTGISGDDFVAEMILRILDADDVQEYQLFWFAWMLQEQLIGTKFAPQLIDKLYKHRNATMISRAKILEIPDNRFGLSELREENLLSGRSDWMSWASAVGTRNTPKAMRNYKLEYFANASQMNYLIAGIVKGIS